LFRSAIFDNFYIVEIKRNIETTNKDEKYFWFYIDTLENTIIRLNFIEMRKKNNMEVRVFKDSKLHFNTSVAMYANENNNYKAIYVTVPINHVPDAVTQLINEYIS